MGLAGCNVGVDLVLAKGGKSQSSHEVDGMREKENQVSWNRVFKSKREKISR